MTKEEFEAERDELSLARITGYLHEEIPLAKEFEAGYTAGALHSLVLRELEDALRTENEFNCWENCKRPSMGSPIHNPMCESSKDVLASLAALRESLQ